MQQVDIPLPPVFDEDFGGLPAPEGCKPAFCPALRAGKKMAKKAAPVEAPAAPVEIPADLRASLAQAGAPVEGMNNET